MLGPWNKGVCRPRGRRLGTRGQRGWGHRGTGCPERRVPREGTSSPPAQAARPPGALSPAQLASPPQSPHTLLSRCPQNRRCMEIRLPRGEADTTPTRPIPVLPPPAPSPGRAFGPRMTAVASPLPGPKQVRPLGAHHPLTPGPGWETEAWRCVTFPRHSLGWGPCPTGSAPRLTAETPDKRPKMLSGPGTGRPVQLLPGSTGLAKGLLLNSCVRLSPSNTPRPTLKGRGWGAPHAVLSRGLGHPRVPAAAHPTPAPLPAGRKQAHEAAQLRRRPSRMTGRGESAGGGGACAPMSAGLLTASANPGSHGPARPRPSLQLAPESTPEEAGHTVPMHRWTRLRGNWEQEAAASGLLPRGYSGLMACGPDQNWPSGGTTGRDPLGSRGHPPPPGTASAPTLQLLRRAGSCQQLWSHPGAPRPSLPRKGQIPGRAASRRPREPPTA